MELQVHIVEDAPAHAIVVRQQEQRVDLIIAAIPDPVALHYTVEFRLPAAVRATARQQLAARGLLLPTLDGDGH